MVATSINTDELDNDSSASSITVPDSSHSFICNLSFSSCRSSIFLYSSPATETYLYNSQKPHKANQTAWEAMNRLRRTQGRVGLSILVCYRLGSGNIGNVYLVIRNLVVGLLQCFYALKVVDREALAIRKALHRADMEKEILTMLDHPVFTNFVCRV